MRAPSRPRARRDAAACLNDELHARGAMDADELATARRKLVGTRQADAAEQAAFLEREVTECNVLY